MTPRTRGSPASTSRHRPASRDAYLLIGERRIAIVSGGRVHDLTGEESDLPWRNALTNVLSNTPSPTETFLVDPDGLSRLWAARALAPGEPMRLYLSGKEGAVVATLGTGFLGMTMPRKPAANVPAHR